MNQGIKEIFESRTKEQIEVILDYFKMPLRASARKSDLVRELSDYLDRDPEVWLRSLLEPDLRILQQLCVAGPGVPVSFLKPDFPTIIEVLKFIESSEPDEEKVELSIPLAMYELVEPHIDAVIESKESEGLFEIERMVLGCLNIYGVMPLKTFVDKIFGGIRNEDRAMDLSGKVAECPLVRIYQEELNGEYYITSPFVDNFQEILEMRRMTYKQVKKYAGMTQSAAVSCGSDAPFCVYGMETPEGIALKDMLKSIGYEGDSLRKMLHTVWMSSQYAIDEDATEILFSPVTDKQDDIPSFEMFRDCINVIVNYANSVPKWLLKGNNALKANKMKLSVRIDELAEAYGGADPYMQLFDLGFAVHPVAPDEPCPCGSGFSYRVCHGKHLS